MRDIVEQAIRGDREAFGLLVNRTSDRLFGIATRIPRDADLAEDALQSALITAWRQLPTLRDPEGAAAPRPGSPPDVVRFDSGGVFR